MSQLLSRFGLRFPDPLDEARFFKSFVLDNLNRVRAAMLLGAAIYYGFSAWDWLIDDRTWRTTHLIRAGVVMLVLLPLFLATYHRPLRRRIEPMLLTYSVVPSVFLPVIYAQLQGGFGHGAAGVVIVVLFVTTLLHIRVAFFAVFGAATWAAFASMQALGAATQPGLQIVNNLYVGTAVILGMCSVVARERLARRQFSTSAALRAAKLAAQDALSRLEATRARLAQTEKLAYLGRLVAGVAHEINTPLGNAQSAITTLQREAGRLDEAVSGGRLLRSELTRTVAVLGQGLALAEESTTRSIRIVQEFRQASSEAQGTETRRIGVGPWLADFARSLPASLRLEPHRLLVEAPDGLCLDTHPDILAAALRRLVDNSLAHAFPDGSAGTLTLHARRTGAGDIEIAYADDGSGIPHEHLGSVFDPFFKIDPATGRTGLGLHIVHNQILALDGRIVIDGRTGQGTRFVITLPPGH